MKAITLSRSNRYCNLRVSRLDRSWYSESGAISNAIGYAKHGSRSHSAVIQLYVTETHEHAGEFKRAVQNRC